MKQGNENIVTDKNTIGEFEGIVNGHADKLVALARYDKILKAIENERNSRHVVSLEQIEAKKVVEQLRDLVSQLRIEGEGEGDRSNDEILREITQRELSLNELLICLQIRSINDMTGIELLPQIGDDSIVAPPGWEHNVQ